MCNHVLGYYFNDEEIIFIDLENISEVTEETMNNVVVFNYCPNCGDNVKSYLIDPCVECTSREYCDYCFSAERYYKKGRGKYENQ